MTKIPSTYLHIKIALDYLPFTFEHLTRAINQMEFNIDVKEDVDFGGIKHERKNDVDIL